jgi:hypothetical protein
MQPTIDQLRRLVMGPIHALQPGGRTTKAPPVGACNWSDCCQESWEA